MPGCCAGVLAPIVYNAPKVDVSITCPDKDDERDAWLKEQLATWIPAGYETVLQTDSYWTQTYQGDWIPLIHITDPTGMLPRPTINLRSD